MKTRAPTDARELEPRPGLASRTGDPIDAWLNLLTGMLPRAHAAEIRDELEDHLRTRVRDQLVEGVPEGEAVRRAIDEVGEASAVAHRFRAAKRSPLRRTMMHVSILTVSAAALGLSVVAYNNTSPAQPTTYESPPVVDLGSLRAVEITTDPNWQFEDFARAIGDAAQQPVFIHWRSLGDIGLERGDVDWKFDVEIRDASFDTVMRLLNERIDWSGVAVRTHEGRLEFASQEYFDQQSIRLVRYDIADIIDAVDWANDPAVAREEIIFLIQRYVESDAWEDNGGALASLSPVGDQLFIQAPERFFHKIEWLLDQLRAGNHVDAGEAAPVDVASLPADEHLDDDAYQIKVGGMFTAWHGAQRYDANVDVNAAMTRMHGLDGVLVQSVKLDHVSGTSYEAVISAPCKSVADARIAAMRAQSMVSVSTLAPIRTTDDDANPVTTVHIRSHFPMDAVAQLTQQLRERHLTTVSTSIVDNNRVQLEGPALDVALAAGLMGEYRHVPEYVPGDDLSGDQPLITLEGAVRQPGMYRLPADAYLPLSRLFELEGAHYDARLEQGVPRSRISDWSTVTVHRSVNGRDHVARTFRGLEMHSSSFRLLAGDRLVYTLAQVHVVEPGDTLASIAAHYYGDADAWELIADAAGIPVRTAEQPRELVVGHRLVIPARP